MKRFAIGSCLLTLALGVASSAQAAMGLSPAVMTPPRSAPVNTSAVESVLTPAVLKPVKAFFEFSYLDNPAPYLARHWTISTTGILIHDGDPVEIIQTQNAGSISGWIYLKVDDPADVVGATSIELFDGTGRSLAAPGDANCFAQSKFSEAECNVQFSPTTALNGYVMELAQGHYTLYVHYADSSVKALRFTSVDDLY